MKNFLRILYILIFVIAGTIVFLHPAKTETNILNAVFSNSTADKTIVELSGRYSSKINVIAESEDSEKSLSAAKEFYEKTDKKIFFVKNYNFDKIFETYQKYGNNLLSQKTIYRLENKNYEEVAGQSLETLYSPLSTALLPLDEDPFMLFNDYVKSLSNGTEEGSVISYNNKYYSIISLGIQPDTALSPSIINGEIKKLVDLQNNLSSGDVKIYLTGAPVHSYYASSKSMKEINLICILSSIFIFALFRFYFSNIKLLIPTAISLGGGMLSGYIAASLIFPSIHVLTFVFSTTLIGICIDYSLHYFIEKDLSKIFKSLTVSMLTTVSAFAILLFSGVELLKEIAVFTMTGLCSVYIMVVLFYPLLKIDSAEKRFQINLPDKIKPVIVSIICIISICGMFFVKFNDDIRNMYVPSKSLANAEKLFKEITGSDTKTTFAIVNGNSFQDLLEKEESLTKHLYNTNFQALSKFIPSHKQQKENQILRKNLYEHSLKNYASFLTEEQIKKLLDMKISDDYLNFEDNDIFSEFLLNKNTSLVVLYDIENPQIITDNGFKHVDVQKDISDRIAHCRKNCLIMVAPILLLLFILLSCIYKPKTAVKIILPSIFASAFSIGLLSLFKVEINLFHILAIFLIIGFGLDYSVFRAGRIQGSSNAVMLSMCTTVFSFLLLAFTGFKLISSLGIILTIGLLTSYLSSLIFDYNKEDSK